MFAYYETPLGYLFLEYSDTVITRFTIVKEIPGTFGTKNELTELAYSQFCQYISKTRITLDFPAAFHGTPFQEQVWNALKTIPYGQTRTYKEIAEQIGRPKAYRAVGQASNRNPLLIMIPCHRVVGTNGAPVGFACGIDIKMKLLEIEKP